MPRLKKTLGLSPSSDAKRISTEWLYGLSPEEAVAFESTWRNSTYVLDRLKAILQRELNSINTDKEDDYNNPQWPVLRADRNGQVRQLKKLISLLP